MQKIRTVYKSITQGILFHDYNLLGLIREHMEIFEIKEVKEVVAGYLQQGLDPKDVLVVFDIDETLVKTYVDHENSKK